MALEKHYTVQEIALAWNVSEETVRRRFRGVPGVLHLGEATRLIGRKYRRGYELLRIPASIEEKIRNEMRGRSTGRVSGKQRDRREREDAVSESSASDGERHVS